MGGEIQAFRISVTIVFQFLELYLKKKKKKVIYFGISPDLIILVKRPVLKYSR